MEPDRLPRLAYEREALEDRKINSWSKGVKNILDQTGFSYVWEQGHNVRINPFVRTLRQRMRDMYIQFWASTCDNSAKFRTYRSFKVNFGMEKYLNDISIAKFRFAYTRLRTGTSYRICDKPVTKCPFCTDEESELHFLTQCQVYNDLRGNYIKHFQNTQFLTISHLINNDNAAIVRDVATYARYAFARRSNKLREIKNKNRARNNK